MSWNRFVRMAIGLLMVSPLPSPAEVHLALPHLQATPGEQILVPLSLSGEAVPGIVSMSIRIQYNAPWLKFIEVRQGELIAGKGFLAQARAVADEQGELLAITLAGAEPLGEGRLMDLVFQVEPSALVREQTELHFTPETRANRGQPPIQTQDGGVSVKPAGDFNGDRVVDFEDFFALADRFESREHEPLFLAEFDLDHSGDINLVDFYLFTRYFGQRY